MGSNNNNDSSIEYPAIVMAAVEEIMQGLADSGTNLPGGDNQALIHSIVSGIKVSYFAGAEMQKRGYHDKLFPVTSENKPEQGN